MNNEATIKPRTSVSAVYCMKLFLFFAIVQRVAAQAQPVICKVDQYYRGICILATRYTNENNPCNGFMDYNVCGGNGVRSQSSQLTSSGRVALNRAAEPQLSQIGHWGCALGREWYRCSGTFAENRNDCPGTDSKLKY
jgi:hypothetical protein